MKAVPSTAETGFMFERDCVAKLTPAGCSGYLRVGGMNWGLEDVTEAAGAAGTCAAKTPNQRKRG